MRALQIVLFTYTLGVTCFFIVYSFYNYDPTATIRHMKPINVETYIEPAKSEAKSYPKYYESNLNEEWPFNITRQYTEWDIREWSEPIYSQSKIASGLGEDGAGFVPPDNMKELMVKLRKENNYNLLASEMISLHRSLPDPRYNECKNLTYPRKLPSTSVVIIFHNEAWTALLRTVWSVIDRSPVDLIEEIILVDDLSTWSFLKRPLYDYIETIPARIKLIRNTKREGLIRSRLIGAQHATVRLLNLLLSRYKALCNVKHNIPESVKVDFSHFLAARQQNTKFLLRRVGCNPRLRLDIYNLSTRLSKKCLSETGQVLTFLDAHIECCKGWLQPLLARIASDRSVIAVPLIDAISSTDMSYKFNRATTYINGFRQTLLFNWMPIPERELIRTHKDKTAPVRTPTMIGCAFSIDKEFFYELGAYDEGMNIWGCENMEMSLRVWQCGGKMEILPCSHVAHLYRISTYTFEGDAEAIKARNSIRLIDVWIPEFRDILYAVIPRNKDHSGGDITERLALKQRLKCKDFRWYLKNVFPESGLNNEFIHFGEIKSRSKKLCLDVWTGNDGDPVKLVSCHNQGGNQMLGLTKAQTIVTSQELCIGVHKNFVVSVPCMQSPRWSYDKKTSWLVHNDSKLCMQARRTKVVLGKCDPDNDRCIWSLISAI